VESCNGAGGDTKNIAQRLTRGRTKTKPKPKAKEKQERSLTLKSGFGMTSKSRSRKRKQEAAANADPSPLKGIRDDRCALRLRVYEVMDRSQACAFWVSFADLFGVFAFIGPVRISRRRARARDRLDITVPVGTPVISAISR
jgi:hypothetical protein